jgi:hypothetical protein
MAGTRSITANVERDLGQSFSEISNFMYNYAVGRRSGFYDQRQPTTFSFTPPPGTPPVATSFSVIFGAALLVTGVVALVYCVRSCCVRSTPAPAQPPAVSMIQMSMTPAAGTVLLSWSDIR